MRAARYVEPTSRYAHGVLGDVIEWGALEIDLEDGRRVRIVLPETRVFEDTAPRLADLDGDGSPEIMAVESDVGRGARLSVYGPAGLVAATPFIGQPFRWLAPVGAADLDGDGTVEVAYVDRPHLDRTLRVWRLRGGALEEVAQAAGFSNHRIGESDIAGGIRNCGTGPEMIVADDEWRQVMAVRLDGDRLTARPIARHTGHETFAAALRCDI